MKSRTWRIPLAAALTVVVIGYALLLWRGPWWIDGAHLRTKNLQPADGVVITGFRTMLVALGAGAVAALGLYYTHKGHKQTEALFEHTREKDREQAELVREGQVTERYVEAIKLLATQNEEGKVRLTERLGGIYALERIMRDSEKDHDTVVQVLAAFVRQRAPLRDVDDPEPDYIRPPLDDVQAALTVLGRRPSRVESQPLDLSFTDLAMADLRKARLQGAILEQVLLLDARLDKADLRDTVLGGAVLVGATLRGADLRGANLMWRGEPAQIQAEQLLSTLFDRTTRLPKILAKDERIRDQHATIALSKNIRLRESQSR